MQNSKRIAIAALVLCAAGIGGYRIAAGQAGDRATSELSVAEYSDDGELRFPGDADRWIVLGAGLGGEYAELPFDPANPGTFGVVQMEPGAYDYFLENGRYADGTMLLLSFYAVQRAPEPALQGFVQGDLVQREIHVIDRQRFPDEDRAFFVYSPDAASAPALPVGSACVECHNEHGAYDATFTQFYPAIRHVVTEPSR
jgi:hypothetical protein